MGNQKKNEIFADLFQTRQISKNQLTEEDKINYFHFLMRGDAPQTFKKISSLNREKLAEILIMFLRNYVKAQSKAATKHIFPQKIFNPTNQKLIDFLDDEVLKLAKGAFGIAAQPILEHFINAKMPTRPKKSRNHAHLQNGIYEQIVTHLEKDLEPNCLEALVVLQ